MATTLFPTDSAQTIGVTPDGPSWNLATLKRFDTVRGSGAVTKTINTLAALGTVIVPANSPVTQVEVSGVVTVTAGTNPEGAGSSSIIWVSDAIAAVTISGSITVNFRALESNAMANYGCQSHIYKIDGSTGATTCIGRGGNTTEIGTTQAATSITITPTSTVFADGDYIAVRFFFGSAGGTSASGFTSSFFYAGSSGASGDTFVTFTETISNFTAAPKTAQATVVMAPYTPA